MLLADVFENFIDTCSKFYGLDPCHCFISPGLSWDAMLKMTCAKLEKSTDIEKQLFIEKGLRGGISYIAKRYAKANNKYMKNYDSKKPSQFITYLDMNNFYGWEMGGYLPYGEFKWLKNVDGFDGNSVSKNSTIGYILEVDLEYTDEFHALLNDYPLAPEKLAIFYDILSDYCKKIADEHGIKVGHMMKLIANLGNKTNYVLHYRNLQLYLSLEMKLNKIYRVLKFKQSDWVKRYIDFNTKKRTNAANSFEKDFFELMINSVYGKTMENLRKRINFRIVNNEKDFLKYTSRRTYITHKILSKNYAAIHEIKPILMINKPIYVGFAVPGLNKCLMYDFHYNFIKKHFDAELLCTDTDSLTDEIKSEDVCEEFFKHKHLFDFSNYPKDSKFLDETYRIIGKMKDVSGGKVNSEFVGLKSKMYSMENTDGKKTNTAKGHIATTFKEFKNTLFNKKMIRHKMRRIQSKNINLEQMKSTKSYYHVLMIKNWF